MPLWNADRWALVPANHITMLKKVNIVLLKECEEDMDETG